MSTIDADVIAKLDEKFRSKNVDKKPKVTNIEEKVIEKDSKQITYSDSLTVDGLAEKLKVNTNEIIKKLIALGIMANKNQELDEDTIELIASEYDTEVIKEIGRAHV